MTFSYLTDIEGPRSRGALLTAGIASVAELGIDQATASDIIGKAGVSRPTFYSYFDDVPGLMADCWVFGGRKWFEDLLWSTLPEGFEKTNEHLVYVDILMSASRTPELSEVVQPTVQEHWARLADCSESEQVRRVWTTATRLGMTASVPVMPSVMTLDKFVAGLALIPDGLGAAPEHVAAVRTGEPLVTEPALPDPDDVTARLIRAVVRVVSASGVAKASMTRVCRAAGVTTGSAKPRFASMADLMARGYDYAVLEVARQNTEQADTVFGGVTPVQAYIRLVNSSLHPNRRSWRRYRQEMHLAARVNETVRTQMTDSIQRVNEVLVSSLRTSGVDESIIDVSIRLNQAQSVGFSLLDDLGFPVRGINNAIIPTLINVEMLAALA